MGGSHKKANFNIAKIVRAETHRGTTQHQGNCALESALQAAVSREMDTVMTPTTTVVVNMMVATAVVLARQVSFSTAKLALARTQKGNPSHKQDKPAQGHAPQAVLSEEMDTAMMQTTTAAANTMAETAAAKEKQTSLSTAHSASVWTRKSKHDKVI